ncbi:MAG TPA: ribbon-helix-helix domain-containing protein [archaeon]|nr:ribbon-helix-helix domain-containing protein [archaeon]
METVSIKLEKQMARQIEKDMKEFRYSTKTEFIRDSIRSKLKENEGERAQKKAMDALVKWRGALKGKSRFKTEEEWHDWRSNEGSKLLEKELAKKYGWKD